MELIKKYCNNCDKFKPFSVVGACYASPLISFREPYDTCMFSAVTSPYKQTIHNRYGAESDEFLELYKDTLKIRKALKDDILAYKLAEEIARDINLKLIGSIIEETRNSANTPEDEK